MSTKIYNGMKIDKSEIMEFLKYFREYNRDVLQKTMREMTASLLETDKAFDLEKYNHIKASPELIKKLICMQEILTLFGDHFGSRFNAWPYNDHWLINASFATPSGSVESLPAFVKEYFYWNNTDAPQEISEEEWTERGDAWETVLNDSSFKLEHTVFDKKDLSSYWIFLGTFSMNEEERRAEILFLSGSFYKNEKGIEP